MAISPICYLAAAVVQVSLKKQNKTQPPQKSSVLALAGVSVWVNNPCCCPGVPAPGQGCVVTLIPASLQHFARGTWLLLLPSTAALCQQQGTGACRAVQGHPLSEHTVDAGCQF